MLTHPTILLTQTSLSRLGFGIRDTIEQMAFGCEDLGTFDLSRGTSSLDILERMFVGSREDDAPHHPLNDAIDFLVVDKLS